MPDDLKTHGPVAVAIITVAEDGEEWGITLSMPKVDHVYTLADIYEHVVRVGRGSDIINEYSVKITTEITFPEVCRA